MKSITATVVARSAELVEVLFTGDDGASEKRKFRADSWDGNSQAIIAEMYSFMAHVDTSPALIAVDEKDLTPIVMTADEAMDISKSSEPIVEAAILDSGKAL